MKFSLVVAAFLPVLAAAASLGERDVEALSNELPEINIDEIDGDFTETSLEPEEDSAESLMGIQAVCPVGYPKYCPRWNFCCRRTAVGCCRNACCARGTQFCGSNGHCYRYT